VTNFSTWYKNGRKSYSNCWVTNFSTYRKILSYFDKFLTTDEWQTFVYKVICYLIVIVISFTINNCNNCNNCSSSNICLVNSHLQITPFNVKIKRGVLTHWKKCYDNHTFQREKSNTRVNPFEGVKSTTFVIYYTCIHLCIIAYQSLIITSRLSLILLISLIASFLSYINYRCKDGNFHPGNDMCPVSPADRPVPIRMGICFRRCPLLPQMAQLVPILLRQERDRLPCDRLWPVRASSPQFFHHRRRVQLRLPGVW